MGSIFHIVLYQPLFNALVFFYDFIPGKDFGVAVILLTIILRTALFPLSAKAFKAQKAMADLQPQIQKIQEQFKENKAELSKKLLALYQKERINPLGSLLPLIIQFPLLIALYQVFRDGFHVEELALLYSFIPSPGSIDPSFFGFLDLSQRSVVVAALAGAFQYIQGKQAMSLTTSLAQSDAVKRIQGPMLYIIPLMTGFLTLQLPSALGLYWITTSLFSIGQQWYLMSKPQKA